MAFDVPATVTHHIIGLSQLAVVIGSGVGTGGSGGSMNRGPELLEPPSSGATEKL